VPALNPHQTAVLTPTLALPLFPSGLCSPPCLPAGPSAIYGCERGCGLSAAPMIRQPHNRRKAQTAISQPHNRRKAQTAWPPPHTKQALPRPLPLTFPFLRGKAGDSRSEGIRSPSG
jgi:hypothetical protein